MSQKRAYTERTVIAAQRRVLNLVAGYAAKHFKADTLYSDGRGLMTGAELQAHINGARKLKVKQ